MTTRSHLLTLFGDREAPDGSFVWENFEDWFGDSETVDVDGRPLVMYHGTLIDFEVFQENARGLHFVSPSPGWVNKFLGDEKGIIPDGASIMPVYVAALNPFDYENKKHVNAVAVAASLGSVAISQIKKGDWQRLEDRTFIGTIKSLGFDGLYVKENGVKNLAVFRADQIKSAIGNSGAYSRDDPELTDRKAILLAKALRAKSAIDVAMHPVKPRHRTGMTQ